MKFPIISVGNIVVNKRR